MMINPTMIFLNRDIYHKIFSGHKYHNLLKPLVFSYKFVAVNTKNKNFFGFFNSFNSDFGFSLGKVLKRGQER